MHTRQRMQLINEIRQVVPLFEVVAWDSDIRVQREYPDPLYPETHTMTQTWYIGGREHWLRLRPMIEQSHNKKREASEIDFEQFDPAELENLPFEF